MKNFTSGAPICSKRQTPVKRCPSDEYARRALRLNRYDLHDELALNNDLAFARQVSESYFINCWQLFEGETLEMWRKYGNGVAIFSRFELLRSQLTVMLDDILVGIVRYGENDMTGYNLIQFLYTKRRHFAKERELRIVLQCYDPVGGANRHYDLNNFPNREPLDGLNPLHEWVHECKRRRIDLKVLVTEVRLSPWATQEEFEEVNTWVKGKNFPCLVTRSDLTSDVTPTLDELRRVESLISEPKLAEAPEPECQGLVGSNPRFTIENQRIICPPWLLVRRVEILLVLVLLLGVLPFAFYNRVCSNVNVVLLCSLRLFFTHD
jgi:hypothetical protein